MAHQRAYAPAALCEYCGASFRPRRDALKKGRGRFCSISCANLSRSKPVTVPVADLVAMYVEQGLTIVQIARNVGACWKEVAKTLHAAGVHMQSGQRTRGSSYSTTQIPQNHPRQNRTGRMATHTLIAEQRLGRCLGKDEVVHHIDGDKTNNDPENLVVVTKIQHGKLHQQLERLARGLLRTGLITFTEEHGYTCSCQLERLSRHV